MKPCNLYNLEYWVNGRLFETIMQNKPIILLRWKKRELLRTGNYKVGALVIKGNFKIKQ